MANKSLRRLLRSGLSLFIRVHEAATTTAAPPAANKLEHLQSLRRYTSTMQAQSAAVISAPTRTAGHFLCLRLHPSQCLSASSASQYASSTDEAEYTTSSNELEEDEKPHALSNSCSKLQYKPRMASFKSLLHQPSSHDQLHDRRCAAEMASYLGSEWKYTRSWSAPSLLHKRHPRVKLPQKAGSFSGSQSKDGSRGKCAPKGHVAVYVEAGQERHVVPIAYLSNPQFQALLERAEREFGYGQQGPGLRLPCSLQELHHTLHSIRTQS